MSKRRQVSNSTSKKSSIVCSGYLLKQGAQSYTTFKKRWFTLTRDAKLFYFENHVSSRDELPLGVVDLVAVEEIYAERGRQQSADAVLASQNSGGGHSVSASPASTSTSTHDRSLSASASSASALGGEQGWKFHLRCPYRTYNFVAATQSEMWRWIEALRYAKAMLDATRIEDSAHHNELMSSAGLRRRLDSTCAELLAEREALAAAKQELLRLQLTQHAQRMENDRLTLRLDESERVYRNARLLLHAHYAAADEEGDEQRNAVVTELRSQLRAERLMRAEWQRRCVDVAKRVRASTETCESCAERLAALDLDALIAQEALLAAATAAAADDDDDDDEAAACIAPAPTLASSELNSPNTHDKQRSATTPVKSAASMHHLSPPRNATPGAPDCDDHGGGQRSASPLLTVASAATRPFQMLTGVGNDAPKCAACSKSFSAFRWRHACASCLKQFCSDCTANQYFPRADSQRPVRLCDECFATLKNATAMRRKAKSERTTTVKPLNSDNKV